MSLKRCIACGRRRLLKFFYKNSQQDRPGAAPYRPECKDCTRDRREQKAAAVASARELVAKRRRR